MLFRSGGTTGQVLAKKSNDDYDTEWVNQGSGGTSDYTDLTNKPQIGGVTLTGNKTLHDLGAATEEAVGAKYTKPSGGIPASDMADGVIPVLTDLIDDTAGDGDTNKVWSADKSADTVQSVLSEIDSTQNSFNELFVVDKSKNLFNKDGIIKPNTAIVVATGEETSHNAQSVQYIPFEGEGYYSVLYPQNYYGSTRKLCLYDSNMTFLRSVDGTSSSSAYEPTPNTFFVSSSNAINVAYIGYCFKTTSIDEAMVVKSTTYPSEYIPYYDNGKRIADDYITMVRYGEKSKNLFNKNGDILYGKAIEVAPTPGGITNSTAQSVQYIPFDGTGTYYCLFPQKYYGTSDINRKLCLYDENKTFLRTVSGTRTVNELSPNPCYFSITASDAVNVAYIGYCFKTDTINTAMFVKDTTYPSEYIPYYPATKYLTEDILVHNKSIPQADKNPLYGKKVVFDGDSICKADGTTGWAQYIGEGNGMDYYNVGENGATITAGLYDSGSNERHWVSRSIDTIHTNHAKLDYLILEGGVNDSDLLDDTDIGTIDQSNFSTFDDTKFVGALESLFYKATSYYPSAKIGFIIAQRMGRISGYGYEADDSPATRRRRKFFEIIISVCKKWGIPYVDLWTESPLCPQLECYYDSTKTEQQNIDAGKAYKDGQHLTQVGYNIISPKIEAWMKTL